MTTFEISVLIPHPDRSYIGAKKEVIIYHKFASNDFFHSAHHSTHVCDEHNEIPIVQSVVAKCDERRSVTVASSVADALDIGRDFPVHRRKPRPLEDDLAMARKTLAERSAELARLDVMLAPVWADEDAVKKNLIATHKGGVTRGLNLVRRGERTVMFKQLDALARKWGKVKTERRFIDSEIRSLGRLVDNLSRQIQKQGSKHGRR